MNAGQLTAVAAGGALGALLRYALVMSLARPPGAFPLGHFAANILGCFLIGVLAAVFATKADAQVLRVFLLTGVLGGFTTYSAFSLDALALIERGQHALAAVYAGGTVALCIGGCALGLLVGRAAIR